MASCDTPEGILLGGKCAAVRTNGDEVVNDFVPRWILNGYCDGRKIPTEFNRTEDYCCSLGSSGSDGSQGIITAVAICLYPAGKPPPAQLPPR